MKEISKDNFRKLALEFHEGVGTYRPRPGKLEIQATKSLVSQRDLSLAYSPGVAEPCKEIQKNPSDVFRYTSRGNLVAVITNGTAVLGLGNIGPLAAKPVMEGKAVLFKRFADIDCFDIELDCKNNEDFIKAVKALEPTFGGINLEDIAAPDCFEIEKTLREQMDIPVFHDDQHGTAIISGAALLNALEIIGKKIEDVKVVFCGGGAASISCARFWLSLGVKLSNCVMTDRDGVINASLGKELNPYKAEFAIKDGKTWHKKTPKTLDEALQGADVFLGLSAANVLKPESLKGMNKDPIVFALANPDPEISYDLAKAARDDMIFATGRSDYPNQINNVLCYPFLFRGALDVQARTVNEEMKIAAAYALSKLAKEDVPDSVLSSYGIERIRFGREYIIPKPLDPRALLFVASAVAKAAVDSGVARRPMPGETVEGYREHLDKLLGTRRSTMREIGSRLKKISGEKSALPKLVFPEGASEKILRAASLIREEKIAEPIFIGDPDKIKGNIHKLHLNDLEGCEMIRPRESVYFEEYVRQFYEMRKRKGMTLDQAENLMRDPFYFAAMHLHNDLAQVCLAGVTRTYPEVIRPNLLIVGSREGKKVAGVYMLIFKDRVVFLADTTVNINPNAEEVAEIAINAADTATFLGFAPRVAMLSFSNFGSTKHPEVLKMSQATGIVQKLRPDILVDGEMQADFAVNPSLLREQFPFSKLNIGKPANVLVFPNLSAANTCYKLLGQLGGAELVGPILVGMNKPVHILQRSTDVNEIVHMALIAVLDYQEAQQKPSNVLVKD